MRSEVKLFIMNKKELVKEIARRTGSTLSESNAMLNATLESIKDSLQKGDAVFIRHFGSFVVKERKPRRSMNINTKKIITIPSKKVVRFSSKILD